MGDTFGNLSSVFVHWLSSVGAELNPKISLADLRNHNAGRGVVASANILEEEVLFRIPRTAIMSVENSKLPALLPQVFGEQDPWLSLILIMIYEYFQGEQSVWKPYFDILPTGFDTLMFWSDDELAEFQASTVVSKIGKATANQSFTEHIIPTVRDNNQVFCCPPCTDEDLLTLAHRMGSTIMAYAFDIEAENGKNEPDEEGYVSEEEDEALPKGMVPLADMLNADADRNNARLFYESDALTMKALSDIKTGEEIFNDYGPLPRSDLLRRYGYVTDNYAQYDVSEIPSSLITSVIESGGILSSSQIQGRLSYLEEQDVLETGYDISRNDVDSGEVSPDFALFLEALLIPSAAFQRLVEKGKLPKVNQLGPESYKVLLQVIDQRLAQYQTSSSHDSGILESEKSGMASISRDPSGRRRIMAIKIRLGEKRILEEMRCKIADKVSSNSESLKRPASDDNNAMSSKKYKS